MDLLKQAVRRALIESQESGVPKLSPEDIARKKGINYLREAINSAHHSLQTISVNSVDESKKLALMLYCTILELSDAAEILASARPTFAVPSLTRQVLDAYIDLSNLLTIPDYWKQLELKDSREWKTILEETSQGKNPTLAPLTENLPDNRRLISEQIKRLEAQGIQPLEVKSRFEQAGEPYAYTALYKQLSAFVHNNVSNLRSRHLVPEGGNLTMVIQPDVALFELSSILQLTTFVANATEKIHTHMSAINSLPEWTTRLKQAIAILDKELTTDKGLKKQPVYISTDS